MNEGNELVHVTPEVDANHCMKIMTGMCAQTGEIAVMMTEVRTLKNCQEEVKTTITDFKKDFADFKGEAEVAHGKLAETLAAVTAALKAEQDAKKNQAENQKLLLNQITAIQNDVKGIDKDVKKIDHNITVMQGELQGIETDVKGHEKRLSGLERVSYWIYAAVGAIVLFVIVISNWATIRSIVDTMTQASEQKPTTNYIFEDNKIYYLKDINGDGKLERLEVKTEIPGLTETEK